MEVLGHAWSQYLHLRAFTGRSSLVESGLAVHAINPASQAVLGCIPALTLAMLYAQTAEYRYGSALQSALTAVLGEALAATLLADLNSFADSGLDRMSAERKAKLAARYAAHDHPAAREVIDWLNGGYAITGEMLQTQ